VPYTPTVISFATMGNGYEAHLLRLIRSAMEVGVAISVDTCPCSGTWVQHCSLKADYIHTQLKAIDRVLWVDADGEFKHYPELIASLPDDVDIAVHRNPRGRVLSGTVMLNNTERARHLADVWVHLCQKDPNTWDQRHLQRAMGHVPGLVVEWLPREYCAVFDRYVVDDPVILHHQASREAKRGERKKRGRGKRRR
jgi:hypothetical protein